MLTKPGVTAASGVSRLKKTITTGAISELAESRLKPSTGRYKDPGPVAALCETAKNLVSFPCVTRW